MTHKKAPMEDESFTSEGDDRGVTKKRPPPRGSSNVQKDKGEEAQGKYHNYSRNTAEHEVSAKDRQKDNLRSFASEKTLSRDNHKNARNTEPSNFMLVHIALENNTVPMVIAPASIKVQDIWEALDNMTFD